MHTPNTSKPRITFLFALLTIALALPTVSAQFFSETPVIQVELLSQEPDPAAPGEVVEIRFNIQNNGKETTEDVIFELLETYPFTIYSGGSTRNIGKLQSIQTGSDAAIVDFKLRIDPDAASGEHEIEARVKIGAQTYLIFTDRIFTIDVRARDAILTIDDVRTEPTPIAAGSISNVTLMLKNYASTTLQNIRVSLDLNNTPFSPATGSSYKRAYQVKADYQLPLLFNLRADPGAEAGVYKIPVIIQYEDERGTAYSRSDLISLVISSTPELIAYVRESTLAGSGTGTVTIELANKGLTGIKFLQLTLLPSEDYEILTISPTIYIGDIDSDDIESEDFDVYVKRNGELTLPVELAYRDANNNPYTDTINIPLRVFSASEQRRYGITSPSILPIILALIILGALGWYWYRRHKK